MELGATELTGVAPEAYRDLKALLEIAGGNVRVRDPVNGLVRMERSVRERLDLDAAGLLLEPERWRSGVLGDGSPCLFPWRWEPEVQPDGTEVVRGRPTSGEDARGPVLYRRLITGLAGARHGEEGFRPAGPVLESCREPADFEKYLQEFATLDWPSYLDETVPAFGVRARSGREESSRALVLNVRVRLVGGAVELRGERFLEDLAERPGLAEALLGRLSEAYVARLTDLLPEAGPGADCIFFAEGPLGGLTEDLYRRRVLPHQARILSFVKKTAKLPVLAGVTFPGGRVERGQMRILGRLLELGVDGFMAGPGPAGAESARAVLPSARELRKELGGDFVIWAAGPGEGLFGKASRRRVKQAVVKLIEEAGPRERMVFSPGPVRAGARPENVLAAIEAARELRP